MKLSGWVGPSVVSARGAPRQAATRKSVGSHVVLRYSGAPSGAVARELGAGGPGADGVGHGRQVLELVGGEGLQLPEPKMQADQAQRRC